MRSALIDDARTLWDLVDRRAERSGEAPLFFDEHGRTLTFRGLRDRALRVAAGLHAMGIGQDTAVTWQLPTRIETVAFSIALSRLGALQNPIIAMYREREVGFCIRQARSNWFVHPGVWRGFDYSAMADSVLSSLDWSAATMVVLDDITLPDGDPSTLPAPPSEPPVGDEPVRWIYSTSGTTSEPKGVLHTDATLIAGAMGLVHAMDLRSDDVGTIVFPYAHIAGPDYLCMALACGIPVVLMEAFQLETAIALFRKHGVTNAGGGTAFYRMYLQAQRQQPDEPLLPSLRWLSGGGSPKPPEMFYEVQTELRCHGTMHGYGMTEVPMISQGSPRDTDEQLANTDGRPVLGAELRIVTSDGSIAPIGVDGEVRVRGPMVCTGYTDPDRTAEAFDEQGFFRTGDIGQLRADGHLCLTGRLKDIIIRKGENISAKEIEDLLYEHPKVGDVAVIGLPDRERGERVCAVVEQAPGNEPLAFDEMRQFLRDAGLMTQKIPEQLEVVDALPRNETLRKVLKFQLRETYG